MPLIESEIEMVHKLRETLERIRMKEQNKLEIGDLYLTLDRLLERFAAMQSGQSQIDYMLHSEIHDSSGEKKKYA